ncbi:cytochrome C [Oceanidesulfovibrio indonesiensis]|uniref:Cytochrome C n=1 Tax=Oceanidesulfovibrio indonesiensis TaxID=54767 RepID=A0A7M3MDS6_9BACT|nr:multiheme c-type cytochrome [Oceanidesulfovibrio indonesiensis]TVM16413.1 cytochrome C [Oceanidesulfovibrio indonesiensis]
MQKNYQFVAVLFVLSMVFFGFGAFSAPSVGAETPSNAEYVGSAACADCHAEEYERFMEFSKKAHSWHSVEIMSSNLTDEELRTCFECHTTGYGKPGGFVSWEKTPDLAHVGCETCHGPGSVHTEYGDPEDITLKPTMEQCISCHSEERVEAFNFKPLIYSGAH